MRRIFSLANFVLSGGLCWAVATQPLVAQQGDKEDVKSPPAKTPDASQRGDEATLDKPANLTSGKDSAKNASARRVDDLKSPAAPDLTAADRTDRKNLRDGGALDDSGASGLGTSLSPRVVTALQRQVAPAYFRGDPVALVTSIGELLPKLDDIQLVEANDIMASMSTPGIDKLLTEARLNIVLQGAGGGVKPPGRHELLVIIPETKRRIREVIDATGGHLAMQPILPAPAEFSEYERLFWRVHVLEQRLTNATRLAQFGVQLRNRAQRFVRRANETEQAVFETDFASDASHLAELTQEIEERKTELRIQRIELALHRLITSEDRRERLDAAYVAGHDGELVNAFFDNIDQQRKQGKTIRLRRPGLQGKELEAEVRELADTALQTAGDLAEKGRLLYTGVHWWLRGRYGRGPEGGGLLKARNATRSPQDMFRLYMPEQLYDFDSKSQGNSIKAPIDRRHHYVWAFEPRRLVKQQFNDEATTKVDTLTSKTTLSYFY